MCDEFPNKYDLSGEYGVGYTRDGYQFYFDLEDFDKIKDCCWHINKQRGYVETSSGQKRRMHRVVLGVTDKNIIVDHINTNNKNDNRKENLRIVTQQQNLLNKKVRSDNKSGVSGVFWHKSRNKWIVNIKRDSHTIYLGYYTNYDDAVAVRKAAEIVYFEEFRPLLGEDEVFHRPTNTEKAEAMQLINEMREKEKSLCKRQWTWKDRDYSREEVFGHV